MIDRRKVYYYRWAGEPKYTGLAMDCQMHQSDGEDRRELWYFDSIHGHALEGEITSETDDGFIFRSDKTGPIGEWTFKELTIEDFRRWVHKYVEQGEIIAVKIRTTADLHEWYRNRFGFPFD